MLNILGAIVVSIWLFILIYDTNLERKKTKKQRDEDREEDEEEDSFLYYDGWFDD
jgi:hypothetical protein